MSYCLFQGIKSVFGGIKNYFSSRNAAAAAGTNNSSQSNSSNISSAPNGNMTAGSGSNAQFNSNRLNGFEVNKFILAQSKSASRHLPISSTIIYDKFLMQIYCMFVG